MARFRFALLGDPVAHSRSPQIHRTLLALSGHQGEYEVIVADVDILGTTVSQLRTGAWDGLNVTMPLKRAAAELSEVLTPQAAHSGSVNTLVMRERRLEGHSTDVSAFLDVLPRFAFAPSALILGAGGSAAAAVTALRESMHLYVAARRPEKAEALTRRLGGDPVAWGAIAAGAVVVNTTPLGMNSENLPDDVLGAAVGLIDLPYGGVVTPAVVRAREEGIPVVDGHEFLLRQAIASFAVWTGERLDFDTVSRSLRKT